MLSEEVVVARLPEHRAWQSVRSKSLKVTAALWLLLPPKPLLARPRRLTFSWFKFHSHAQVGISRPRSSLQLHEATHSKSLIGGSNEAVPGLRNKIYDLSVPGPTFLKLYDYHSSSSKAHSPSTSSHHVMVETSDLLNVHFSAWRDHKVVIASTPICSGHLISRWPAPKYPRS